MDLARSGRSLRNTPRKTLPIPIWTWYPPPVRTEPVPSPKIGEPILLNGENGMRGDQKCAPNAGEKYRWTWPNSDAVCATNRATRYSTTKYSSMRGNPNK